MQGKSIYILFFLAYFLTPALSECQSITISGYIQDRASGEKLFGANVYSVAESKGTISNAEGFYELEIPATDSLTVIRYSYMGYTPRFIEIHSGADTALTVFLQPDHRQLEEVVVAANTNHQQFHSGLMNVSYLTAADIKSTPGMLGEPDVIKVLQLKPGMQSGNEGSSGFFVRGGQADQNLVLFDGVPVYNPTHLFGMFSVFPTDAIENVKLYKGAFPARFGGRLSSVLDVGIRPGSMKELKVAGGTGLISSRLTIEGPLVKDKVSVLVSARRTYFDLITKEINKANAAKEGYQPIPDYFFYDLSGKVQARLSSRDELTITGYGGHDQFDFSSDKIGFNFLWGNKVGAVKWKHEYHNGFSQSIGVSYTGYQYRLVNKYEGLAQTVGSGINDVSLFANFNYRIKEKHSLSFGMLLTKHKFNVLRQDAIELEESLQPQAGREEQIGATEGAIYIGDNWQLNKEFSINAGLRVSGFMDESDSLSTTKSNLENGYIGFEPRISSRYQLGKKVAIKASYSKANQYVHLVSSSGSSLPANFWYPSGNKIKPQLARQLAVGADILFGDEKFLLSNEIYYRHMKNQIDFRDGAELFGDPVVTNDLVFGKGWAYGNEFYIEKKKGKTTGWVGYTLSWTYRQFEEINEGSPFPATNDRRHDVTLVLNQEIGSRFSLAANWVFCSGNVTTLPQSRVLLQGQKGSNAYVVPVFSERNSIRMEAYHRLDVGLVYKFNPRWGEADLVLGVYNLYNRRNPYFIYFEQEQQGKKGELEFSARQISLFPILPSISFNYSF